MRRLPSLVTCVVLSCLLGACSPSVRAPGTPAPHIPRAFVHVDNQNYSYVSVYLTEPRTLLGYVDALSEATFKIPLVGERNGDFTIEALANAWTLDLNTGSSLSADCLVRMTIGPQPSISHIEGC